MDTGRIPIIRTSSRKATLALTTLLVAAASISAQPKRPPADIDQYRNFFLKSSKEEPKDGTVKVTFLGTAALLFDDGETQLLIDGFFSRPSLLKVAGKIETDKKVVDEVLKRAKVDRLEGAVRHALALRSLV